MSEPSLALQKLIRARLYGSGELAAIMPGVNIIDSVGMPDRFPCIIIGEGQTVYGDFEGETFFDRAYATLHVWTAEPALSSVKSIAGIVHGTLQPRPWTVEGYRCTRLQVTSTRYLRDPDGMHAHGIVNVEAILQAGS